MPRLLKDLLLTEVSSVDRGAGDGVRIMLMKRYEHFLHPDITLAGLDPELIAYAKRDFSAKERDAAAASGAAMPDGSFPIKNTGDLKNAIRLAGNAKDPAKAKAHIRARAKALGASDAIPESWGKSLAFDIGESEGEDDDNVIDFRALKRAGGQQENDMTTPTAEQITKQIADAVGAAMVPLQETIAKLTDENAILKLTPAEQEFCKAMTPEQKKAFAAKDKAGKDKEMDDCAKAALFNLPPEIKKQLEEAATNSAIVKGLQEKDEIATFAKRATDCGLTADKGEVLRKAWKGDAASQGEVEKLFAELTKARDGALKTGKVLTEFGSSQSGVGKAIDTLNAKAEEMRKAAAAAGKEMSPQQAFAKVYSDPSNKELVEQEKAERQRAA